MAEAAGDHRHIVFQASHGFLIAAYYLCRIRTYVSPEIITAGPVARRKLPGQHGGGC